MHMKSLKVLRPTVWEEMHLQENTLFDLGFKVTQEEAMYPLHHVTYVRAQYEVATSNGFGDVFTRKLII